MSLTRLLNQPQGKNAIAPLPWKPERTPSSTPARLRQLKPSRIQRRPVAGKDSARVE